MPTTSRDQQRRRATRRDDRLLVRIELKDGFGRPRWVTADTLDRTPGGLGVSLLTPLQIGSVIPLRGRLGDDPLADIVRRASVKWCIESSGGVFRAGLEFIDDNASEKQAPPNAASAAPIEDPDYYEILQLSPNASADTIHRVYRILAQRYHPDNQETGDPDMFVRISEAQEVLGDPEHRAAYDVRHRQTRQLRWKIFDQSSATVGHAAEVNKRRGILGLLYAKTLHDPDRAALTIHDFEELLGCPREHLETALWYLKGKGYVQRSDNGKYTITIPGFDHAEAQAATEQTPATPAPAPPDSTYQLPPVHRSGRS